MASAAHRCAAEHRLRITDLKYCYSYRRQCCRKVLNSVLHNDALQDRIVLKQQVIKNLFQGKVKHYECEQPSGSTTAADFSIV
jgi:hypothetical protein